MRVRFVIVFLLIFRTAVISAAAPPGFRWAVRAGNIPQPDRAYALAVDSAGNAVVTGVISSGAEFGTNVVAGLGEDMFVAAYDPDGVVRWVRSAGGFGLDAGRGIGLDAAGNSYVAGHFQDRIEFGTNALSSTGPNSMFLVKYDSAGELLWVRQADGTAGALGFDLAVDLEGNSYVVGGFDRGTVRFGAREITGTNGWQVFVAKYSAPGELIWLQLLGGGESFFAVSPSGISVDAGGKVTVAGSFEGTAVFGSLSVTSDVGSDIFVTRLDRDGQLQWIRTAGSQEQFDYVSDVLADPAGNVYITGTIGENAAFGTTPVANSVNQFYLAKYDPGGALLWLRAEGDCLGHRGGSSLVLDGAGAVYVAGSGGPPTDGFSDEPPPPEGAYYFISKHDANGTELWRRLAQASYSIYSSGLGVDGQGRVYGAGYFHGRAQFDAVTIDSGGPPPGFTRDPYEIFVAQLDPAWPITSTPPVSPGAPGPVSTLDRWQFGNPQPSGNEFLAVAYGGGVYVAAGKFGALARSIGGTTWESQVSGTTEHLNALAYGAGKFVAVGDRGRILTSADGVSWVTERAPTRLPLNGVAFGNGQFIAVGTDGVVLVSTNGTAWTRHETGLCRPLSAIAFGQGRFVAVGGSALIMVTTNGVDWSAVESGAPSFVGFDAVAFSNDQFMIAGSNHTVTSQDGLQWTYLGFSVPAFHALRGLAGLGREFVAVGQSDRPVIFLSRFGGVLWDSQPTGLAEAGGLNGIVRGPDLFVAVGSRGLILTSPDGKAWTNRRAGVTADFFGLAQGNGMFAAVGALGAIATSVDARQWTAHESGVTNPITDIAFGAGSFVALSQSNLLHSTTGISWTTHSAGTTAPLFDIIYGGGLFVAAGSAGTILTSTDGVSWSIQVTGVTNAISTLAYGNGRFVAVGESGLVLTSTDGRAWSRAGPGAGTGAPSFLSLAFGRGLFVGLTTEFVGFTAIARILTSRDGINWDERYQQAGVVLRDVAFDGQTFLAAGNSTGINTTKESPIVTSEDGVNWVLRSTDVEAALFGTGFGAGRFVAVGAGGAIIHAEAPPVVPFEPAFRGQRAEGGFGLLVKVEPGQRFRIEWTADLKTWTGLGTFTAVESTNELLDVTVSRVPQRFYRLVNP